MTWTRDLAQGAVPGARNCHSLATIKGRLYMLGGYDLVRMTAHSSELFVYDPGEPALLLNHFILYAPDMAAS